jgi:DNA-binding transcriptional ArsR family regulator
MRESRLLPILRSQTQGELLARLFLNPEREFMLSDLARALAVSVPGIHHEAVRLIEAGYITERREGRNRLVRANTEMVISEPLTTLLALTYGPIPMIEDALKNLKGIEKIFIYGSWAKRYSGVAGGVPRDIDLGIVGSVKTDDIYGPLTQIEETLIREVNFTIFSVSDWKSGSPLINEIKRNPIIFINLE